MSAQEVRDIEQYFPTEPWLQRYREAIEASESYAEDGAGWGVDWNGAFIFQIEGIPLAERTLDDLPDEILAQLDEDVREMDADDVEAVLESAREAVRERVAERDGDVHERALAELPDILRDLLTQLEESVVDGDTVYAFLDIYDGGCREVDVLDSPEARDHGFRLVGDYDSWRSLVAGDGGIMDMVMSGQFELEGDMQKLLQYSDGAVALAEVAADLDTRFIL